MRRLSLVVIGGGLIVLAIIANFTLFVVRETEQALVLQFGNPLRVIQEPGLEFKWPFVQNVQYFEDRLLTYDPPTEEVILGDTKRLQVSTSLIYRIVDPLLFYQRVRDERGVIERLRAANSSTLRSVLAEVSQETVLSEQRGQLMTNIQEGMSDQVERLGIDLVDVRILRAELPEQNTARVLERMQTEREQEARLIRSEGEQAATEMRADADLQQAELVAGAQREAQRIRGEADNYGLSTLATAYAGDEEFFRFYYRLTRYPDALAGETTTIYMGADSHFLNLLNGQDFDLASSPFAEIGNGDGSLDIEPPAIDDLAPPMDPSDPLAPADGSGPDLPEPLPLETGQPEADQPEADQPEVDLQEPEPADPIDAGDDAETEPNP
ncbi:MAG: SPFH domain-containing protein [Alphaproteobacteria bacterium]